MSQFQTPLWNHYSTFDPLAAGIESIIITFIIFFLFTYPFLRVEKNGFYKTIQIIIIPIFLAMVASFFGLPAVIVGILAIVIYILVLKQKTSMSNKDTLLLGFKLGTILAIISFLEPLLKSIFILILILYFFFESEKIKKKMKK